MTGKHHRWERSHLVGEAVRNGWNDEAYQLTRQMIVLDEDQLAL